MTCNIQGQTLKVVKIRSIYSKVGNFKTNFANFLSFFVFFILSSAKKMGRPILANLPTYYVPFLSHNARPTYLPKIGTSLMDVPICNSLLCINLSKHQCIFDCINFYFSNPSSLQLSKMTSLDYIYFCCIQAILLVDFGMVSCG